MDQPLEQPPPGPLTETLLKTRLHTLAQAHHLHLLGIADATAPLPHPAHTHYTHWLASGCHAGMRWLENNNERRLHPPAFFPTARSILILGANYYQRPPGTGYTLARYALGPDYHNHLLKRLKKLCAAMRTLGGQQRPSVDTAPVMEKVLAAQTTAGWQGKNTLLINPVHGPWLLLGTIFTTLSLPPDPPHPNRCGPCTRCHDACPTQALVSPAHLDARRCLAYLTIEHHGPIPPELRPAMGTRMFGCDTCIEACPWGRRATPTTDPGFTLRAFPTPLRDTLAWTRETFDTQFSGTPFKRLGLARWQRNACVVLGNIGDASDLPALGQFNATTRDTEPMLAEHAAWALARIRERPGFTA